jgi:fructokinase
LAVSGGRVVCLGEAVVDLMGRAPAASVAEVEAFSPAAGGSLANVAAVAARFGADVRFLGGAGGDDWGLWLRDRLAAEGVDVSRFVMAPGGATSLAFVAHSPDGEPSFHFHEGADRPAGHAGDDLDPALSGEPGCLALGSDTLLGAGEREVTMGAAELAAARGWAVLVDPNLRPARWGDEAEMLEVIGSLAARAKVLKLNQEEAGELTGLGDAAAAASALRERGPRTVVLTRSERGAVLASAAGVSEVPAPPVPAVVDATGAGDAVTGVLAAALARGVGAHALEPALRLAMRTAGGVVGHRGALEGLPGRAAARAALADL